MSNIRDVAKKAGVSVATVSNALTSNRCVNVKTKARIKKIADELNYSPSMIASSMITKKTNIYGVFFYDYGPSNYLPYSEFLGGVVKKCQNSGQRVLVYADIKESELQSSFIYGREPIDGGLIFCPQADEFRTNLLKNASIPFVFIGRPPAPNISFVDTKNGKNAYIVTKKMIEAGHKKIALFNAQKSWLMANDIDSGFIKAIEEGGLNIDDCHINYYSGEKKNDLAVLDSLLDKGYDCIVSLYTFIVDSIYRKAAKGKFIIGEDLSVGFLGYDSKFDYVKPSLTCFKLQYDDVGEAAVELLNKNMKENSDKKNNVDNVNSDKNGIYIDCKLIEGNSIRK